MTVLNFPGPYQLRLYYTTTPVGFQPIQHVAKYNIDLQSVHVLGGAFSVMNIKVRSGATVTLQAYVDAWVVLMKATMALAANNTIDYVELWLYEEGTFNAQFISTYPIAVAGTNAGAANPSGQAIITFRTIEGGIMKLSFMEGVIGGSVTDTPPFANAPLEAIQAFVSSTANAFLGADTSYPFATRALFPGSNEALFRLRFRP